MNENRYRQRYEDELNEKIREQEKYIESLEDDRQRLLDDNYELQQKNDELEERVKELEDLIDEFMNGIKSLKYIKYY